jgi:hypothetical protein
VGVDENFVPNQETEYNVSGLPKSKLLHNTVRGLMKLNQHPTIARITRALPSQGAIDAILRRYNRNLLKPEISSEMRLELTAIYRDDILKLQDLIRRDLSHWL